MANRLEPMLSMTRSTDNPPTLTPQLMKSGKVGKFCASLF